MLQGDEVLRPRSRSTIMGTTGSVFIDRDGYEIYDLKGKKTGVFKDGGTDLFF